MNERAFLFAVATTVSLSSLSCGGEPPAPLEREGDAAHAWSIVFPHPSSPGDFAVQTDDLEFSVPDYGPTAARVFYPLNRRREVPRNTPFVVLLNGNGFDETHYDYLGSHLAEHGVAVLALRADAASPPQNCPSVFVHCVADRAERAHGVVGEFRNNWVHAERIDFNTLGVVGHSQGGEAALRLAQLVSQDGDLGDPSPRAVVAMAPSDIDAIRLDGDAARSLLVLYGTNDEDVRAKLVGEQTASTLEPHPGPFAVYDRAGTEADIDGSSPTRDRLRKHMKLIYGANHRQFSDLCGFGACEPNWADAISCDGQQHVTKGMVNAFLRWHLLNEDKLQIFFNGQIYGGYAWFSPEPGEWIDAFPQHSDGLGTRRVIDNFQDGKLADGNISGAQFAVGTGLSAAVVNNQEMLPRSPHGPSGGYRLHVSGIDGTANAWIGWLFEDAGVTVDATPYTHLRFRVGRILGGRDLRTMADSPLDDEPGYAVRVQVVAGGKLSNKLTTWNNATAPTDGRGHLPEPHLAVGTYSTPGTPLCALSIHTSQQLTMAHMRSFRLPLEELDVDLSSITEILLSFDSPVMVGEELYIDNVELVTEPGMP